MNNAQNIIYTQVIGIYRDNGGLPLDEKQIEIYVDFFSKIPGLNYNLTNEEKVELLKEIKHYVELNVDKSPSAYLVERNHKPWYLHAKAQNEQNIYWKRYRDYLFFQKHYNQPVVDAIDSATDDIMDFLGNPALSKGISFMRRGLVLGDVQSGKTGTYIALINKAADVGYKVIILLTGVIEKLRQQTQQRIDEGFIGSDSAAMVKNIKTSEPIGVGKFYSNDQAPTTCLTSTEEDFNSRLANNVVSNLQAINGPMILVVKKNKSVLTKLHQWFTTRNNVVAGGKIDFPLLLIDDEADNASINTNKDDTNPTIINKCIRDLLNLFTKSNYVGFTATPYANIFIKPDTDDEMLNADLFPQDFIYVLRKPSNYIGPEEIFDEQGNCSFMLKRIDDKLEEAFLPEKHKNGATVGPLPEPLKEAICSFFIANTILDLRHQETTHRSMLINISRFINVQNSIRDAVEGYVKTYQRAIENYSMSKNPLQHEELRFIKAVYDKHFDPNRNIHTTEEMTFSWEEVLHALYRATIPIVVRAVNKDNAQKNLCYSDYEKTGLRVIAVGGFSLSRGLTLEGLCTSYYFRNSKMYDTLMQMGRWFGYRDHYADVCQIWMNDTSRNWYREITLATRELKDDLRRMSNQGKTPKEFGLWVRSDSTALYVTAKNKMRNAEKVSRKITFSGRIIETPYLKKSEQFNDKIRERTKLFINAILELNGGFSQTEGLHRPSTSLVRNVPSEMITSYLNDIKLSGDQTIIDKELIINYINASDALKTWDVAIASGEGDAVWEFRGKKIHNVQRNFRISDYSYVISGKNSRVGDTETYGIGLTKVQYEEIESNVKATQNKNLSQTDLFAPGIIRNPLLVIYPVELKIGDKTRKEEPDKVPALEKVLETAGTKPYVAIGMGFPCAVGEKPIEYTYTMNSTKRRELLEADEDFSTEDEEGQVDD